MPLFELDSLKLGDLAFELTMKAGDHESHNRYRTSVTVPSP